MKTWDDVTKEEIFQEIAPGVSATNDYLVNQLNWTEYLRHMRDMLFMGMIDDPMITREHLQDVVADIFMNMTNAIEGRFPEPDEISNYIRSPYAQETINKLTSLALNLTEENWPEFRDSICKEVELDPSDF